MRFLKLIHLREILFFIFSASYYAATKIIYFFSDRANFILWAIIFTAVYSFYQYYKIGQEILEKEEALKILSIPFLFALSILCCYFVAIISFVFHLIFTKKA